MSNKEKEMTHRILVIDDNPSIHKDFQTILLDEEESETLNALRNEVFGNKTNATKVTKTNLMFIFLICLHLPKCSDRTQSSLDESFLDQILPAQEDPLFFYGCMCPYGLLSHIY